MLGRSQYRKTSWERIDEHTSGLITSSVNRDASWDRHARIIQVEVDRLLHILYN
jgi:hypothetical protein